MANVGSIRIEFDANMRRINGAFDSLNRRLNELDRRVGSSREGISRSNIAIGNAYTMMADVAVRAIFRVIEKVKDLAVESSKMAIEHEGSFLRMQRTFGSASNSMEDFVTRQARALNMSQADATRYASTFGVLNKSIGLTDDQLALLTKSLLRTGAQIKSQESRFTMDQVLEKMRSGILGNVNAIDDLSIEVKVGMLKTTKAFKRFAGDKAWEKIDQPIKQLILSLAIMEQAGRVTGNELLDTTGSSLQKLSSIIDDIKLNLGQAFLPLIQKAIPVLIDLAEVVLEVAIAFKTLMHWLFGVEEAADSTSELSDSQKDLGKNVKKTNKDIKGNLTALDELNIIQEKSTSSGADMLKNLELIKELGDLGLDTDFGDFDISESKWFKAVKDGIELPFKLIFGENKWEDIKQYLFDSDFLEIIKNGINLPFNKVFGESKWEAVKNKLFDNDFLGVLERGLTFPIRLFFSEEELSNLKSAVFEKGILGVISDGMDTIERTIVEKWEGIKEGFFSAWETVETAVMFPFEFSYDEEGFNNAFKFLKENVLENLLGIENITEAKWGDIGDVIKQSIKDVTGFDWDSITKTITSMWKDSRGETNDWWWNIKQRVLQSLVDITGFDWFNITKTIADMWKNNDMNTTTIWDSIKETIKNSIDSVVGKINKIIGFINNIKIKVPAVDIPGIGRVGGQTISMPQIPTIPRFEGDSSNNAGTGTAGAAAGAAGVSLIGTTANTLEKAVTTSDTGSDSSIYKQMFDAITDAIGQQGDTKIELDGTELGRAIVPYLNKENSRVGNVLISTL